MSHLPIWPHPRRESSGLSFLQSAGASQALPPALLEATGQALESGQLDLDSAALSAGLNLGQNDLLAHLQRTAQESGSGSQQEISNLLAASIGVGPVTSFSGQDAASQAILAGFLPPSRGGHHRHSDDTPRADSHSRHLPDDDEAAESEEGSDDGEGGKRSKQATVTEEDRKRRRQDINRQSARRIRERRSHELESLKQQVNNLQHQQQLLLRYAAQLAREKNALVQRTLELTERWNQAAAENLELRQRMQEVGQALPPQAPQPPHLSLPSATAHMPH